MSTEGKDASLDQTTLQVRRAIGGDLQSLSWIVERLSPLLILQARRRLGPAAPHLGDPEDLVSSAWLVTLPKLEQLRPRDDRLTPVLLSFLGQVILNQANNLLRQHAAGATAPLAAGAAVADDRTGPVSRAIRNERSEAALACLGELAPDDQEILILRDLEGLSNQDAARRLGISPKAAVMRRQRALQRLRESLPDSVFDELED